jgi:hypothetical protein
MYSVCHVKRYRALPEAGGHTLMFGIAPGHRKGRWIWFKPHEVPEFEGESAWFEIDFRKGRCVFVRQVPPSDRVSGSL